MEPFFGSVGASRRDASYGQREFLRTMSSISRVRICGTRRADGEMPVPVRQDGCGRAYYSNLQLCANVHVCPVCAAKIRYQRALEIAVACSIALSMGWGIEFVTLTMPHDQGDRLAALLVAVAESYTATRSGRAAQAEREMLGILHTIKALEITVGPNGWHPHLHVLVFTARPLTSRQRRQLRNGWHGRWADAIEHAGYRRPLRRLCDVRQVWNAAGVGRYVAAVDNVANEMARADLKQGRGSDHRSPWRLLADLVECGEVDDLSLWHEYERAMKGKYALRWSAGLKALLGQAESPTDEEVVLQSTNDPTIAVISAALWPVVCNIRGMRLHILQVAEREGVEAVNELLAKLELEAFGEALPIEGGGAPPPGSRENRQAEVRLAAIRLLR